MEVNEIVSLDYNCSSSLSGVNENKQHQTQLQQVTDYYK